MDFWASVQLQGYNPQMIQIQERKRIQFFSTNIIYWLHANIVYVNIRLLKGELILVLPNQMKNIKPAFPLPENKNNNTPPRNTKPLQLSIFRG